MRIIKNLILKKSGKEKLGTKFFTSSDTMLNHLREKYVNAGYVVKSYKSRHTNDDVLELCNISIAKIKEL